MINGGSFALSSEKRIKLQLPAHETSYCNAQLDDYHNLPRKQFRWSLSAKMEIEARASHPDPPGTLGFGFWNDPFTLSIGQAGAARRFPALPQALWFFYGSKENDIQLGGDTSGYGWKAQSIRSPSIPSLLLAPMAAMGIPMTIVPQIRRILWKYATRIIHTTEIKLDVPLSRKHLYAIEWKQEGAIFFVDGNEVLNVARPPTCPLGFVLWIDNQFAIASPEKGLRFGIVPTIHGQWLEIELRTLNHIQPTHAS